MDRSEKIKIFRNRFYGRQDVYGRGWVTIRDGKSIKGFSPACANYWKDDCHIKLKDGITCAKCEIKKYDPLTDDTIWDHINGSTPNLHYILLEDGTVRFAALDLDMKPGKEKVGHTFEDVLKVSMLLKSVGIPHGIARSTGAGHHVYIFFSDAVDARKVRSVFWWVFERVGFLTEAAEGIRPLPEMFPKQGSIEGGLGNGIKPPMIEPNFKKGRNCFIKDDNTVHEDQWGYLDSIPRLSEQDLDNIILRENISLENELAGRRGSSEGKWQQPTIGSIHKVLEGCAAFKRVKEKCEKGTVPSHEEGFALWHMCISVADGEEWFMLNVPGWGKEEKDLQQLQQSKDKCYKPWSCKTMQDKGVCVVGTKCFDKKPPLVVINGVVQEDATVPESEWPSPSPFRYAIGKGEVYLSKLLRSVDEAMALATPEEQKDKIKETIPQASVLDDEQQSKLKDKIEETGLLKKSQLNKLFSTAKKHQDAKTAERLAKRDDTVTVGNMIFKRTVDPYSYIRVMNADKKEDEVIISNFVLDIEEERVFLNEEEVKDRKFLGKFKSDSYETKFEISLKDWEGKDFSTFFATLVGSNWVLPRQFVDTLKLVSVACTQKDMQQKPKIRVKQIFDVQGWYKATFIMPSVCVDKEGVKPNTYLPIDNTLKEHARFLDFSILTGSELSDTLFHIKSDLFAAFPHYSLFNCLGFALMAGLIRYLKLPYMPTLWIEGESGTGKTALCMLMQKFWGDFKGPLNWNTTFQSMVGYGHDFKDCLLLVDDFKELGGIHKTQLCQQLIQHAYEYSMRGAKNQDGSQRTTQFSRCLYMMTGEETPVHETSFIARLLLIYYPKHDISQTKYLYDRCVEMSKFYRGVTPYFIYWVLNQKESDIKEEFKQITDELQSDSKNLTNGNRIAYNIGIGHLGWNLFVDFMFSYGALNKNEAEELKRENWEYCKSQWTKQMDRGLEEKNSLVFLYRVKELLHSNVFSIEGLAGYELGEKIGFVDPKEPEYAYLYPAKVIDEVKRRSSMPLTLNQVAIGSQLKNQGIILVDEPNRYTVQKQLGGSRLRMWKFDLVKLELIKQGLSVVKDEVKSEKPTPTIHTKRVPNADGIY